jgi:carotenoid cleavage dioxygenase
MHSFSLTENHVIVYDLPVTLDPTAISAYCDPAPPSGFPYRWDAAYQARLGVLSRNRDAADPRWFEIKPCYLFHTMNAYITTGACGRRRASPQVVRSQTGPERGRTDARSVDDRPNAGKVFEERLDDRAQEFPRIDERLTGRRHRYGYSVGGTLQLATPLQA